MLGSDHWERLHGDDVLLFLRNRIWQACVYAQDRKYFFRSLKAASIGAARQAAMELYFDIRAKI